MYYIKISANAGDPSSVPELGRSPGEGNHYPLQYSGLEKSMDRGVWQGFQRVGPWGPLGSQRLGHDWATSLSLSVSMYMFPCYCLHSSHPLLPLLCPQVCSLCLHLYSCPANRFISIIFLDSIHMSLPSWTSLLPATLSYLSRLSQSTRLSSLCYIATSH